MAVTAGEIADDEARCTSGWLNRVILRELKATEESGLPA